MGRDYVFLNFTEYKKRVRIKGVLNLIASALLGFILSLVVVASIGLVIDYFINIQKSRVNNVRALNTAIQSNVNKVMEIKREIDTINHKTNIFNTINERRYLSIKLLNTLSEDTPGGIELTKVVYNNPSVAIFGFAKSNEVISLYITKLKESDGIIKNPKLVATETSRESSDIIIFNINADILDVNKDKTHIGPRELKLIEEDAMRITITESMGVE